MISKELLTLVNLFRFSALLILVSPVIIQYLNAGLALIAGVLFSLFLGNPIQNYSQKWADVLLKMSVVGLGFGLNFKSLLNTALDSLWLTVFTIILTLLFGLVIGRLLGIKGKLSVLISSGTAICGGSAIAAMSPTIHAKQDQTAIAISIVFILNGIALYIFPVLGHYFGLTQEQFGLWAALGVHDTSSVVGAASLYGEEALEIATTAKLSRALWVIPLVVGASWFIKSTEHSAKQTSSKWPYFIFLFLLASAASTFLPALKDVTTYFVSFSKIGLVLSLFFIGAGVNKKLLSSLDFKPLLQAMILWMLIASGSLVVILNYL